MGEGRFRMIADVRFDRNPLVFDANLLAIGANRQESFEVFDLLEVSIGYGDHDRAENENADCLDNAFHPVDWCRRGAEDGARNI